MKTAGDASLLEKHAGYGNLLAYMRNLPEMKDLWLEYSFKYGSRGRGNGQAENSPLAGSNIWLADSYQCVIVTQANKGRGPLLIRVYVCESGSTFLSERVWQIVHQYNLPYAELGSL